MGSPAYPTEGQVEQLKHASELPPSENPAETREGEVIIVLPQLRRLG
jgi:hypothetical protein